MTIEEDKASKAIERLTRSSLIGNNAVQAVFLVLHAFLLEEGFVCVVEQGAATAGFAPSLRGMHLCNTAGMHLTVNAELPASEFAPASWTADPSSISTRYKHKQAAGKQFNLVVLGMDDSLVVTLSARNGDSFNMDFPAADHVSGTTATNLPALYVRFIELVYALVPALRPVPRPAAPQEHWQQPAPAPVPQPWQGRPQPAMAPPSIFNAGHRDLDPFYGGPGGPQGGSLVGPDHPLFGQPPGHGYGYPQPRFDPFGPVPGPNDLDFGDDEDPLRIGRGGGGWGRGRGAGRGGPGPGRTFPGEPNPDHFKPPGW